MLAAIAVASAASCTVDTEGTGSATNPPDAGGGTGGSGGGTGGTSGTSGTGGTGGSCFPASDEKLCGNVCPKKTDPAYGCAGSSCAACEFPNAGAICQGGQCQMAACNADYADCNADPSDGCEANLQADPTNCSSCGNNCSAGGGAKAWACNAGKCEVTQCDVGYGDCDKDPTNKCEVDLQTDVNNCGFCGNVCNLVHANAKCVAGQCVVDTCQSGWKNCDTANPNACTQDIATDPNNCGDCGKKCDTTNGAATCVGGSCQISCAPGYGDCDNNAANGCETNLNTTASACGACNTPCSSNHGTPTCAGGQCSIQCAAGFVDCNTDARTDGCEANINTNPANCGGCGQACSTNNGTRSCSGGNCAIACNSGFGDCDGNARTNGCERSLRTVTDCGACNTACSNNHGTPGCNSNGVCTIACSAGYGNCDNNAQSNGCEQAVNTISDCGGCGITCSNNHGAPACTGGACQIACSNGWADCDNNPQSNGCETNIDNNTNNCGACNKKCSNVNGTPSCAGGNCSIACSAGYADCDGNVANGCEVNTNTDPLNCSGCGKPCSTVHNTPSCSGGTCSVSCNASWGDCDNNPDNGCEKDFSKPSDCGACANKCTGSQTCTDTGGGVYACQ